MSELSFTEFFIVCLVLVFPFVRIFRKAGFSPWLGITMLIPLFNIGMLYFLAIKKWPITERLESLLHDEEYL